VVYPEPAIARHVGYSVTMAAPLRWSVLEAGMGKERRAATFGER